MNCLVSMTALYSPDVRFGDNMVAPMRYCKNLWTLIYRPPLLIGVGWDKVAIRIVLFAPLILMTIAAAFLCIIGLTLKMCSSFPPALDRFKHFSILDDASTQLSLPDSTERKISPESAELFSTFEKDCINHVLTFLSFRDKRKLLQVSQYFKTVIEESPTWNLYCEGLEAEQRRIELFDNNLDHLRWVFTPAFKAFYKPLARHEDFSLIKKLPKATITMESEKFNMLFFDSFDQSIRAVLNSLIDNQYGKEYCFRVILTSPDGSVGDGIVFHDSEDIEERHFFVIYGDPSEGTIYTRYLKGRNFEDAYYKEKYLVREFKTYALDYFFRLGQNHPV